MSNGVDGETSPNEIGVDFSMRGLLSDEQTGRNSIGGEYVVMVLSGSVMPEKNCNNFNRFFSHFYLIFEKSDVFSLNSYLLLHSTTVWLSFSNRAMVSDSRMSSAFEGKNHHLEGA